MQKSMECKHTASVELEILITTIKVTSPKTVVVKIQTLAFGLRQLIIIIMYFLMKVKLAHSCK